MKVKCGKSSRRSQIRIGPGEFRDPNIPTMDALTLFFDAVKRLVPAVFDELRPLEQTGAGRIAQLGDKIFPFMLRDLDHLRVFDDVAVLNWARGRGLADPYPLQTITASMLGWFTGCKQRGTWIVGGQFVWPESIDDPMPHPVWNPRHESAAAFRVRVEAYMQAVTGAEYSRGAEPTPMKRSRPGEPIERHFEWLALYVVGGLTLEAIAEQYGGVAGLDLSTVSRGIHAAADLAGVTVLARV